MIPCNDRDAWVNIFIILVNSDPFVSAWNSLGSSYCFPQFLYRIVYVGVSTDISLLKLTLSFALTQWLAFDIQVWVTNEVWFAFILWVLKGAMECPVIKVHTQSCVLHQHSCEEERSVHKKFYKRDFMWQSEPFTGSFFTGEVWVGRQGLEEDVVSSLTQRMVDLSATGRGPSEVVTNVALFSLGSMEMSKISKDLCSLHTSPTINFTS